MKLLLEKFKKFAEEVHKLVCPPATQDLELNTKNRDTAIQAEHIQYGPLNVSEPENYWQNIAAHWNTSEKAARKSLCGNCVAFDISPRMKDCMPGETSDQDGQLGYCWMHHFKCHSARSCYTWAKGGPIKDDNKSAEWQEKNKSSLGEETKDTYGSEVVDRNKATFKNALVEDEKVSPDQAIADEGGALGFSKWEELTGMSREELEKYVKDNDHIEIHRHGDIIDTKGLNEDIEITEDIVVNEDEICAAGKAWAKRTYDKWPSAYASMGASKKCDQLGHKKDESLQEEGELKKWRDENWVQSDGTPCGDAKAQKNPKRCKPKSKWATMSDKEKKADNAKKKAGGKKGKQFVPATKKGKVTKSHTKEGMDMNLTKSRLKEIIQEEIENIFEEEYYEVDAKDVNEEYCPVCQEAQIEEKKKKKACKPSKGKRFASRVDGKCVSHGQAGKAKDGGDRIRPGTAKGDAYCARSAKIKKCKNPPCANTLSRKKWKCRGSKSVA
jgi:hypothetical protein